MAPDYPHHPEPNTGEYAHLVASSQAVFSVLLLSTIHSLVCDHSLHVTGLLPKVD